MENDFLADSLAQNHGFNLPLDLQSPNNGPPYKSRFNKGFKNSFKQAKKKK
jgi:hypothetical protein